MNKWILLLLAAVLASERAMKDTRTDDPKIILNSYLTSELNRNDLAVASKSMEDFEIETHIRKQLLVNGPLFIAVEGISLSYPGIDDLSLTLKPEQYIYAPGTDDVVPDGICIDQHLAWRWLVSDFARRYNLVMYYEASKAGVYPKLSPDIDSIKDIFRFNDTSWKNMSIESKVLLQAQEIEYSRLVAKLKQQQSETESKKGAMNKQDVDD